MPALSTWLNPFRFKCVNQPVSRADILKEQQGMLT